MACGKLEIAHFTKYFHVNVNNGEHYGLLGTCVYRTSYQMFLVYWMDDCRKSVHLPMAVQCLQEYTTDRSSVVVMQLLLLLLLLRCRYPQLVESLVVLDSSPEIPRRGPSPVGDLLALLRGLDLECLSNRREADKQLRDKIPVSCVCTTPPFSTLPSLSKANPPVYQSVGRRSV